MHWRPWFSCLRSQLLARLPSDGSGSFWLGLCFLSETQGAEFPDRLGVAEVGGAGPNEASGGSAEGREGDPAPLPSLDSQSLRRALCHAGPLSRPSASLPRGVRGVQRELACVGCGLLAVQGIVS